jgi:AraC family transcriptional regulator, regulatory protein of adaptative response / DNA-3-methyladenine glycosylase II
MDDDARYRAVLGKDARFDGWFFTAVTSTGIYCRPSCPAITPKRANVRFHPTAAAAQRAGFRACKRCRPDATPGSPEWNTRADLVGRAMRLIADGVVDREGVSGLADRLAYSDRQLNRLLTEEVGAGPLALARSQRAQTARILIETTDVPFSACAFGAGFSSIRQFNDTIVEVYASTPTLLRERRTAASTTQRSPGHVRLRLAFRAPLDADGLLSFFALRCVTGVEEVIGGTYRRTLRLPHGDGIVALTPHADHVACDVQLADARDLAAAVQRSRRLFDLDADPVSIAETFATDPLLSPLAAAFPGRRSPGHVDGAELAVRAVLGQQVSVAGARTQAGRLVARLGTSLSIADATLTHVFPCAEAIAASDPALLGMPTARARALLGMMAAIADRRVVIDAGVDREQLAASLVALPGIGPWTAAYVRMRALGDPDVFLPTDLGVRHALERLGHPGDPRSAASLAERWRPYRSYALSLLWASL